MTEQQTPQTTQKSSFIGRLLGTLIGSLILSIIIEWVGMAFIWQDQGVNHSKQMMAQEFAWFSNEFQQSLLYSRPVALAQETVQFLYQWIFVKTGLQTWLDTPKSSEWELWLFNYMRSYIEATLYILIVFVIRLMIIILTSPLFMLAGLVGLIDGLVQRDLRRFGVGRESAYKYHHAKRWVAPVMFLAWIIYLSIPISIHPNFILIPSAILFGVMISLTASNFKKYL